MNAVLAALGDAYAGIRGLRFRQLHLAKNGADDQHLAGVEQRRGVGPARDVPRGEEEIRRADVDGKSK